ncbi:MAG: TetR/AcrR family transcriptional regulator [Desulfobulbaceae bacterium]|nr:TetR/AcrR family transcriptional regulator [Desulfobulbaceae bacterium]
MTKKEAILQAAILFFSEKGYRETSMGDIAKATGVADGTVFYHFKTKEDLFLAVLANFKESVIQEFERYLLENKFDTGLEMVEGIISFYFGMVARMEECFLLLHRHYPYRLAEENPICRKHLEDIYNCFLNIFEKAVLMGQRDGSIAPMSARKTALILFTMVDGLARMNTYNLYHAGNLFNELLESCRKILKKDKA